MSERNEDAAVENAREWVVGFLMDDDASEVVLIRKNRPEWQRGRLNGVGGKVEHGETLGQAMVREFHEETGVWHRYWHHYLTLRWDQGLVHFWRAFAPMDVLASCRTVTDESVERHSIWRLAEPGPGREYVTPNLLWLVPLAAHRHDTYERLEVVEQSTTLRKVGRAGSHLIDPWVCPPCRRGEHAGCMEPSGAEERVCHCTSCAPRDGRTLDGA